ncbi:alpha-D-ribose 1-methylphosphonate 5-triphosphate diphosphatase [Streptomyces zagrosensis]|uniref:Alpha-D-ribose 1-methylphosphonate 5-triphosphate diphosphatase n=1 Tax=Streptomyces zagrosensis TaxID=1042984 RepID=A0A7W9QAI4_9ACTN|nr:alpha-D-ribose 1-methylphosphonate 5-triphosphate diphosphatase [Streptomyces zagrosensis]MBB5935467.1 alpha-D-ribose 1-methylphosphonate 5-triphosphate diphosphatase [Streptomyces zagrosensis]
MSRYVFVHARAVLPDRVLDDALVTVEDGLITEVGDATAGAVPAEAADLRGALLMPGIVDTHSDALEREQRPRPTVEFPPEFAVVSFEGRVRAAGVTTMHHAVSYQTHARKDRTIERSLALATAVRERAAAGLSLIDHRLLHRLDARDADALSVLRTALADLPVAGVPPLVSYEDHTPGQGQYRDLHSYLRMIQDQEKIGAVEAEALVTRQISARAQGVPQRAVALAYLSEQARAGRIRLLAHDVESPDEVAGVREAGAAVAEFPTTIAAARAAMAAGMSVVAGAPNVLRGSSHSGNVSATELVAAGLVDNLSSDYMPTTLLAAALWLAREGVVPLPRAVALITSGAASTAGLADRGALLPGLRADLIVVTADSGQHTVRMSLLAEESRQTTDAPVSVARLLAAAGGRA